MSFNLSRLAAARGGYPRPGIRAWTRV